MQFTRKQLNDADFMQALTKLYNSDRTGDAAYWIGRAYRALDAEVNRTRQRWINDICKKHCKLDEKGIPEFEGANPKFENPEKQAAYNKEFDSMLEETFEVKFYPVSYHKVKNIGLTAKEITALEVILKDLPEGGDGPTPTIMDMALAK